MNWVLWIVVFYGSGGLFQPRAERFDTKSQCEASYNDYADMLKENTNRPFAVMKLKHRCSRIAPLTEGSRDQRATSPRD